MNRYRELFENAKRHHQTTQHVVAADDRLLGEGPKSIGFQCLECDDHDEQMPFTEVSTTPETMEIRRTWKMQLGMAPPG